MLSFLKLFFSIYISFLFFDALWLGIAAKNLYQETMGPLLRKVNGQLSPNWFGAIGVYILLTLGIIFFALPKANGSYLYAFLWGTFFGLITYGVYDLTSLAIIANWSYKITLIDMVWGSILCGLVSMVANYVNS